jgi:methylmalonyl-CoA mutase
MPFDHHVRQPDEFSKRIARNQQIILSEEAYLDKVEDPAAGSYYIEKLTEDLGQQAWELFQDIETEGGLLKAIENGTIQSAIQESQQKKNQAVASRKRIFVGTNQYPNPDDAMADKIESGYKATSLSESEDEEYNVREIPDDLADAFAKGASMGDVVPSLFDFGKHYIRTVSPYRGPQAFENLRMATENHETTPKVLMLPMGNRKMRKARSTFSSNFFGCAGYDIEEPIGFENVDEAMQAVQEQSPDIAVICSSDKEYKELVTAICDSMSQLDQQPIIVLAGYPKDDIETYKQAGVDEFIYANCNVLETLTRFQQKLNIIEN